jgi:hypothetical protein
MVEKVDKPKNGDVGATFNNVSGCKKVKLVNYNDKLENYSNDSNSIKKKFKKVFDNVSLTFRKSKN